MHLACLPAGGPIQLSRSDNHISQSSVLPAARGAQAGTQAGAFLSRSDRFVVAISTSLTSKETKNAIHCWFHWTGTDGKRDGGPVLGSVLRASEGSLVIFAGGRPADVAWVQPVLEVLGKKVHEFADGSRATNTKLLANFFIAGMVGTLAQGVLFARSAGIDISTFLEILGQSALNASMVQTKAPAMAVGDYTSRFYLEHMRKDVHLATRWPAFAKRPRRGAAAASAEALGVRMPYMPLLAKLLYDAKTVGFAKKDYSTVFVCPPWVAGDPLLGDSWGYSSCLPPIHIPQILHYIRKTRRRQAQFA